MMDRSTYLAVFGDHTINSVGVFIDRANPDRQRLIDEVRERRALPVCRPSPRRELRGRILSVFDSTFAVTRSMRMLAIIVAFFGIAGALLTLFIERQREFGIYRALGFSARQVAAMTLLEGLGMGMVSLVLEPLHRDGPRRDTDKGDQPEELQLDGFLLSRMGTLPCGRRHRAAREHGRGALSNLEGAAHLSPYAAQGGMSTRMRRKGLRSFFFMLCSVATASLPPAACGRGRPRAVAAGDGPEGVEFPEGPRGPSGLPDRMVVLHRQPQGRAGERFRVSAHVFPAGDTAEARGPCRSLVVYATSTWPISP